MIDDYGVIRNKEKPISLINSKTKFTKDGGLSKFVRDFNKKLKVDNEKNPSSQSFTDKYMYYKDFLQNFKDRKERSSSRQGQGKRL